MKYKLEFCPNPDVIEIHLQKKLVARLQIFHSPEDKVPVYEGQVYVSDKEPPLFVKRLWEIEGITNISVDHYSIQLEKGSAFDWNKMVERIIAVLNLELFPKEEMERLGQPKRPSKTLLKALRGQGCDV